MSSPATVWVWEIHAKLDFLNSRCGEGNIKDLYEDNEGTLNHKVSKKFLIIEETEDLKYLKNLLKESHPEYFI